MVRSTGIWICYPGLIKKCMVIEKYFETVVRVRIARIHLFDALRDRINVFGCDSLKF